MKIILKKSRLKANLIIGIIITITEVDSRIMTRIRRVIEKIKIQIMKK